MDVKLANNRLARGFAVKVTVLGLILEHGTVRCSDLRKKFEAGDARAQARLLEYDFAVWTGFASFSHLLGSLLDSGYVVVVNADRPPQNDELDPLFLRATEYAGNPKAAALRQWNDDFLELLSIWK